MCVEDGDASSRVTRAAERVRYMRSDARDAGARRLMRRGVVACCKVSLILATTRNFKFKGGRRTKTSPPWPLP